MKTVTVFFFALCGAQIYGYPTYYKEVYVSNELLDAVAAMGNFGYSSIRPAIDQYADIVSRVQYSINAAVNNLYEAFCGQPINLVLQLRPLRMNVANLLADSSFKLITSFRSLLHRASEIRRIRTNVDRPLSKVITSAIQNGTKCVQDLGLTVTNSLIMKTASVASAAQKREDLTAYPHLLENLMNMISTHALADAKKCIQTFVEVANSQIDAVQSQDSSTNSSNVEAIGSNVDIVYRGDIPFEQLSVPEPFIAKLNKLGNFGDKLKPTLDKIAVEISNHRFEVSKALHSFDDMLRFALSKDNSMGIEFRDLQHTLTDVTNEPITSFVTKFVTDLVRASGALLSPNAAKQTKADSPQVLQIFVDAINDGCVCVTQVSDFITRAVTSGAQAISSAASIKGSYGAQRDLPNFYTNLKTIASEALASVPDCLSSQVANATAAFEKLQKLLVNNTTVSPQAPIPLPEPASLPAHPAASAAVPPSNSTALVPATESNATATASTDAKSPAKPPVSVAVEPKKTAEKEEHSAAMPVSAPAPVSAADPAGADPTGADATHAPAPAPAPTDEHPTVAVAPKS